MACQNYWKAHKAIFEQEGSHNLTSVFQQMARATNLLDTEIHEVQEVWTGWQGSKATNHAAKASQRDIQFFCMVMPNESPNIMGLKGIHSPKALHQGSCSFCPFWCEKEGQNEGMVVNHLQTMHYHLGLVCTLCIDFFTTSTDAMRWHTHICKSIAAEDNDCKEKELEMMMMAVRTVTTLRRPNQPPAFHDSTSTTNPSTTSALVP